MEIKEWLGENNQLGIDIWKGKYQKDNETFDEWLDRVSGGNKEVRQLIVDKKFLFGGRILSNRGMDKRGQKVTLSNCYVIEPPEDSIESIFECATKLARTYSYGGGCGVDLSKLAPRGAKVNNTAKYTTGSVSFMDLYSLVTGLIGQNGRRGALMLSISSEHPDLEEFISVKTDLNKVTKANISVRMSDDFMRAVAKDTEYNLQFIREETKEIIVKTVKARDIFMKLAETNWDYAEPGILYWDSIEKRCLLEHDTNFKFAGTNPCAEEPLPAGGSCLLGSINLAEFVKKDGKFDFVDFRKAVGIAVEALNEVLDEGLELHPLQEQRDSVRNWRQIGLGIFGLADMLIKMGIEYGTREAIHICDMIGFEMANSAIEKSALMAEELGVYPMYNHYAILESKFLKENTDERVYQLVKDHGLYNSQLLTIAPTGTLSTMLGVSGGIEPIFANYYERKTESLHGEDVYYKVYTPIVKDYMEANHISDDKDLPDYFITAKDLDYVSRINMQGVWQDHIDASISSTVNLPNEATVEEVADLYLRAWKRGLKGITIFRDGCARLPILSTNEKKEDKVLMRGEVIKANDRCVGKKRTLITGCGTLHCEAFFDPDSGELRETYLSKGSSGGCNNFMIGLSRMISLAARGGVSVDDILDQLMSSGTCPSYAVRKATKKDTSKGSCCPVAVANALRSMYDEMQMELGNKKIPEDKKVENKSICPSCGEPLIFEGGCNSCKACGWSKCDL
jgi:ribonucleoside-diphosphate reductase alpha chain